MQWFGRWTCDSAVVRSIFGCRAIGYRHLPPETSLGQAAHTRVPPSPSSNFCTDKSWDVNKHTTRCTSPVSVVSRHKLAEGYLHGDQRRPMGRCGSGRALRFYTGHSRQGRIQRGYIGRVPRFQTRGTKYKNLRMFSILLRTCFCEM